jgi:hypothetical protein
MMSQSSEQESKMIISVTASMHKNRHPHIHAYTYIQSIQNLVKEGTECKIGHKIQTTQYKYVLSNSQTVLKCYITLIMYSWMEDYSHF